MTAAGRDPIHIHRLFASLLGLWLAFLLNRPSPQHLSGWWVLAVVTVGALHVTQLQAGFDQTQRRARGRIHLVNMGTVLLSAVALVWIDQFLHGPNCGEPLKVILVAAVVWGWILTHAAYKFFGPERSYFQG